MTYSTYSFKLIFFIDFFNFNPAILIPFLKERNHLILEGNCYNCSHIIPSASHRSIIFRFYITTVQWNDVDIIKINILIFGRFNTFLIFLKFLFYFELPNENSSFSTSNDLMISSAIKEGPRNIISKRNIVLKRVSLLPFISSIIINDQEIGLFFLTMSGNCYHFGRGWVFVPGKGSNRVLTIVYYVMFDDFALQVWNHIKNKYFAIGTACGYAQAVALWTKFDVFYWVVTLRYNHLLLPNLFF